MSDSPRDGAADTGRRRPGAGRQRLDHVHRRRRERRIPPSASDARSRVTGNSAVSEGPVRPGPPGRRRPVRAFRQQRRRIDEPTTARSPATPSTAPTVNGNFTRRKTGTWDTPGLVHVLHLAGELVRRAGDAVHADRDVPLARLGRSQRRSPRSPRRPGRRSRSRSRGRARPRRSVYAAIRGAGGAPCATVLQRRLRERAHQRPQRQRRVQRDDDDDPVRRPAYYLICLWLADSSSDAAPVAGPQPATFTVVERPRPCVVPAMPQFTLLAPYLVSVVDGQLRRRAPSATPRASRIRAARSSR